MSKSSASLSELSISRVPGSLIPSSLFCAFPSFKRLCSPGWNHAGPLLPPGGAGAGSGFLRVQAEMIKDAWWSGLRPSLQDLFCCKNSISFSVVNYIIKSLL